MCQTALKVLRDHRDIMDKMVRLLIEQETIYAEEVDMLMEGKSVAEVTEFIEKKNAGDGRTGADYTYHAKKFSDVIVPASKADDKDAAEEVITAEGKRKTSKKEPPKTDDKE